MAAGRLKNWSLKLVLKLDVYYVWKVLKLHQHVTGCNSPDFSGLSHYSTDSVNKSCGV